MITRITGVIASVEQNRAEIVVESLQYEVLIPDFVRRQLQSKVGKSVSLHTIEYLEGNPTQGRLIPRLVGFSSPAEREFFEQFCSVDGVGARKALRAMVRPVREVAIMIEEQDAKGLSTLPGIGAATAERVIAKLRRKMSRFALLVAPEAPAGVEGGADVIRDVFEALLALGHAESEARRLVDVVLESKSAPPKTVEEFLQEIYKRTR